MPYRCLNCDLVTGNPNYHCTKAVACGFKVGRFERTDDTGELSAAEQKFADDRTRVGMWTIFIVFVLALLGAVLLDRRVDYGVYRVARRYRVVIKLERRDLG